jgi:hypothetical protein
MMRESGEGRGGSGGRERDGIRIVAAKGGGGVSKASKGRKF